ncbi:MAG TPA: hydantoinase/oxoprolinase family protein [Gaiellaceae bacterium]|nr:hydantoinase/oxoprolinase family protein [Gaiellaceae bacterium]
MAASRVIRIAVDVGGTFTDLVCEHSDGRFSIHKSPTTPDDPARGMLDALEIAAQEEGTTLRELLEPVELFVHGTTRATNAIISGDTARTALLVTEGHPDILLWREGTRVNTFDYAQQNPEPYVPRWLTFEVPERIDAQGNVVKPLDEPAAVQVIESLRSLEVEAVAVCLLWSILNGTHELRIGELLAEHLPGVPYTLSHVLTPVMREYRRASAASIDASLKPVMSNYLDGVASRLADAGLRGRLLMMTSSGGVRDLEDVARTPIHSTASGPAAAPVAGRHYANRDAGADTAIVTDAGGTSYDVSLVRRGAIPWTREAKLGISPYGHMTGFPSVDIRSIGAGGGSIAWVDDGGVLHVGPRSAGAVPGPAAYGRGGTEPTVTDATLVVRYLDPDFFLGGRMQLDPKAAAKALETSIAGPLSMSLEEAASAVLELQVEHMVGAIEAITLDQGVDPRSAVLIAGGGSAGFYSVAIARKLGCAKVVVPEMAAALSATGALLSDLSAEYYATFLTTSDDFDFERVNRLLKILELECQQFISTSAAVSTESVIHYAVEARYRDQIWELDVPFDKPRVEDAQDVAELRRRFDRVHNEILAHVDPDSDVEFVTWKTKVECRLRGGPIATPEARIGSANPTRRDVHFHDSGRLETTILDLDSLTVGEEVQGPAIVQSPVTTIVIDPGARATRTKTASLVIETGAEGPDLRDLDALDVIGRVP